MGGHKTLALENVNLEDLPFHGSGGSNEYF